MAASPVLTPAEKIANLNSDSRKIADLLAALRNVSFASLCPAGRAELGNALAALNRADQECDAQIEREEAGQRWHGRHEWM